MGFFVETAFDVSQKTFQNHSFFKKELEFIKISGLCAGTRQQACQK